MHRVIAQDARTPQQYQHIVWLWVELSALLKLPITDEAQADRRIGVSITILQQVIIGLEYMGPMTEEYIRKLFHYGEQALRILASTLSKRHSGRKIDFSIAAQGPDQPKQSKSMKDKRAIRRLYIQTQVWHLAQLDPGDAHRLAYAVGAIGLCSGDAIVIRQEGDGSKVKLPQIGKVDGKVDERWEAEVWAFVTCALAGMAQCLGHRFMRWPVEIAGQIVPGTGQKKEVLEDWEAVEDAMAAFK
ncbi:hypothetical protein LTR36_010230 [Oleoguttula mirabilis]|uniref:Uncharacterized protein n=1 Tax=Oleoguttula mirabilis TaxID=1507867 RepID=A0AAV9JS93_9PEZI|nr:hypothetical protein LTR36_010230 [Oleoguttula mirabilis]